MGLGSLLFSVPHFLTDSYSLSVESNSSAALDNVCRPAVRRDQYRQFEQITGIESIGKLAEGLHGRSAAPAPARRPPPMPRMARRMSRAPRTGR